MPEGDTVYRTARRLHDALAGEVLTASDMRVPAFATADLAGLRVDEVRSRGKHILMRIDGWTVHSHLKMEGSWHLYRNGSAWRRPAHRARIVLETPEWQAVGFDLGAVDVVPRSDEDTLVGHLGPDLLGEDWDEDEAVRSLLRDERPVGVALLDQRNLAGLGNEYANELCFLRGVLPHSHRDDPETVRSTVRLAHRLIVANRDRPVRTTTGDTRRGHERYVYGRAGRPCRRCGAIIEHGMLGANELSERDAYWCPRCQT